MGNNLSISPIHRLTGNLALQSSKRVSRDSNREPLVLSTKGEQEMALTPEVTKQIIAS
jgi:hypothetical protein